MVGKDNPRLQIVAVEPADSFKKGQWMVVSLTEGEQLRVYVECAKLIGPVWHLLGMVTSVLVPGYSARWAEDYENHRVLIIIGRHGWLRLAEERTADVTRTE